MKKLNAWSCVALLLSLLAPAVSSAQNSEADVATAKEHFSKAQVFYDLQDWPSAIRELRLAYQASPKQDYLFMIGQAQRLSGDCPAAILTYRAFIRRATGAGAAAAEGLIHGCERQIEKAAKEEAARRSAPPTAPAPVSRATASPPPTAAAPASVPTAEASAPGPWHWYADPLGDTLFIAGVAAAVTGSYFVITGNARVTGAGNGATYGVYATQLSSGQTDQKIGVAVLAGSGALIAGAFWRYLSGGSHADGTALLVAPSPNGATVGFSGHF